MTIQQKGGPPPGGSQAQRQEEQQPESFETTLLFDMEDGVKLPEPRALSIVITPALARVFVRAASTSRNSSSDPPLSFSTLLVAMLADEDGWLQRHFETQRARFDAIREHRSYDTESLQELNEDGLSSQYLTSMSARAALEEALRIARLTSRGTPIDVRHLGAAYPILPRWHAEDFERFEIDRLEWARAFGAEMAQRFPHERQYWGSYADRASPVPLTSFSADVYTEEDLLGIDRGVDALALLIASSRTVTPLAIGVFGPWGSGKTFFMRHLQKRIVGIRADEQARIGAWIDKRNRKEAKPEDAPLYFGQIAQVEFNAWHYNEGNLVASLVEHLFRNLRVLPNDGDKELAERRAGMLRQLKVLTSELTTVGDVIKEAERNVATAKGYVESAKQEAEQARKQVREKADAIESQNVALAAEREKLGEAISAIDLKAGDVDPRAAAAVAFGPLEPVLRKVKEALGSFRKEAFDWKDFIGRVFSTKGLTVVALCAAAPLVLWLLNALEGQWAAFMGSIAGVLAALGNAIDVLKRHRAKFEEEMAKLEAEQQKLADKAKAEVIAQHEESTKQVQGKLTDLKTKLDSLRAGLGARETEVTQASQDLAERTRVHEAKVAERIAAEDKVRLAEAEYDRLSSALLLEEFISDRSSTDEYRKQLGFLALVRRDIERLSMLIDQANRNWMDHGNKDVQPPLNRIVLYIDDLDRCKESTVLAVLEAVHLLLAFPLFVCAVAVDPRWIEQCLREARPQLFKSDEPEESDGDGRRENKDGGNGNGARTSAGNSKLGTPVTVGDYLEKIFQIPIWMSPIGKTTRATLVNSLLGPTAAPAPRRARDGGPGDEGKSVRSEQRAGPDAFQQLVDKARERPDPLRISTEEAEFVDDIAGILSERPRALKRFVNVYRLLKASLPDIERATFVDASPSSSYRICLSQLALFTSQPRLAPALVAAFGKPKDDAETTTANVLAPNETLKQWFDRLGAAKDPALEAAFDLIPNRDELLVEPFRRWLPHTSRYLFHRAD